MDERIMDSHINRYLWDRFWHSAPQQQAHAAIYAEIERFGYQTTDPVKIQLWRTFIKDFVLEISLFGYCIFKIVANNIPIILSGRYVELVEMSPKQWKPKAFGASRKQLTGTKGWKVVVFNEPILNSTGQYLHPASAAFKSRDADETLASIYTNMVRRDKLNSNPSIFTTISKVIRSQHGDNSHPWFPTLAHDITGAISLDDLVRERVQTIDSLNTVTSHVRMVDMAHRIGEVPTQSEKTHGEHIVSDGRDYTEARHLTQDSEIIRNTVDRLCHEILFAWGVPPQVMGKNINSERLASSNQLTERAINIFRAHIKSVKLCIELAVSMMQTPSEPRLMEFGDCAQPFMLDCLKDIIKPERLAQLYACAYDIDVNDFDIELIRQNQTGNQAGASQANVDIYKKRKRTSEEKLNGKQRQAIAE